MTRAEKRRNAKAAAKLEQYRKSKFRANEQRISATPTPTKSSHIPEDQRVSDRHIRAVQKMDWRKAMQKLGYPVTIRAPHAPLGTPKRKHSPSATRERYMVRGARP